LLSTLPDAVPGAIEHLQVDARDQKRAITTLQTELARHQAAEFAAAAELHPRARLVLQAVDADAPVLKSLASAIVSNAGFVAILVSRTPPSLVVAARSPDVQISSHEIVVGLTKQFGGRGGGKPDLAQGGGLNGTAEAILAEARRLISQL
jgi:alanyl-tRNA synthetase